MTLAQNKTEKELLKSGTAKYYQNDFKGAEEDYFKIIVINQSNKNAYKNLIQLYGNTNQWKKAIDFYEKTKDLNLYSDEEYYVLWKSHVNVGKINEGKVFLEKCLKIDTENIYYITDFAWYKVYNNELSEAFNILKYHNIQSIDKYKILATIKAFENDFKSSIKYFNEALFYMDDESARAKCLVLK